jgi:hypothetical protein
MARLAISSSVVSKSPYETIIAGLRLTRSWSAAEARGTWGRRQPLECLSKRTIELRMESRSLGGRKMWQKKVKA